MKQSQKSRRNFLRQFSSAAAAAAALPRIPSLFSIPSRQDVVLDRPLAVGQIGTAHPHADGKFAAMLLATADWQVVGWSERDPELARRAEARHPYNRAPRLTADELLQRKDIKALAIETSLNQATEMAQAAIDQGKHIHLDKPGGIDHLAFVALHRSAQARGLTVQMGYMLRYNPAFRLLFQAVQEGWLGEITEIDASMGKLADEETRKLIRQQPGGAMFEIGCHLIDIIVKLLGAPEEVVAFNTPSTDDGLPDNQLAVLRYPRATANVRTNFADPFGNPRRRFNVTGTEGSFEIQPLESGKVVLSLTRERGEFRRGTQTIQLPMVGGRYDGEFADLARVIRNQQPFGWSPQHDIDVHATTLRAAGMRAI